MSIKERLRRMPSGRYWKNKHFPIQDISSPLSSISWKQDLGNLESFGETCFQSAKQSQLCAFPFPQTFSWFLLLVLKESKILLESKNKTIVFYDIWNPKQSENVLQNDNVRRRKYMFVVLFTQPVGSSPPTRQTCALATRWSLNRWSSSRWSGNLSSLASPRVGSSRRQAWQTDERSLKDAPKIWGVKGYMQNISHRNRYPLPTYIFCQKTVGVISNHTPLYSREECSITPPPPKKKKKKKKRLIEKQIKGN